MARQGKNQRNCVAVLSFFFCLFNSEHSGAFISKEAGSMLLQ